MKKTKVTMNKSVYLGPSIVDITNKAIYDHWYSIQNESMEIMPSYTAGV